MSYHYLTWSLSIFICFPHKTQYTISNKYEWPKLSEIFFGASGQIIHRLVKYSNSIDNKQNSISSDKDNIYAFVNRIISLKHLKKYSCSDAECDIENVNPNIITLLKSDGKYTEDDEPLAKIAKSNKTDLKKNCLYLTTVLLKTVHVKKLLN